MVDHPYRIAVIYNPRSGNGATGRNWPQVESRLRQQVGPVTAMPTQRPAHAWQLARQALQQGYDRIVCVGGDGTLNEVVGGFFDEGRPVNPQASLAVLPLGTASDYPRSLGLPRDGSSFAFAASQHTIPVDVGMVSLHDAQGRPRTAYFVNVAHFGLGGVISRQVSRGRKTLGGFVPYFLGVMRSLWRFEKPLMEVTIDGKLLAGRFVNVFVANGRYIGGGLQVAPTSILDDGRLAVTIIGDLGRFEVLRGIIGLYLMNYFKKDRVWTFHAEEVRAISPQPVLVNLDGEPAGALPLTIRVLPRALPMALAAA